MLDGLPASWSAVRGGDLFEVVRGVTYAKPQASDLPADGRIAIYRAGNLQAGRILDSDLVWVESNCVSEGQILRPGDMVVAMSSGSPEIVGKVSAYPGSPAPRSFGAFCGGIRPSTPVVADWLRQYFQSKHYRQTVSDLAAGVNINNLKRDHLESLELPLPPEAEQRRIVAKLDALQSRTHLAREALAALPALLDHYRQSVLAAAFRGDLSKDWRMSMSSGADPMQDRDGLPSIPASWSWTRLPELGALGRGKSRHRPRNDPALYGGPHPFIQTGDVARSQGRVRSHSQTYTEMGLQQSRLWPAGTVVITIAANIADSALLTYAACFPDSVVGFIPNTLRLRPDYAEYFIRTAKRDLAAFAPATAQKNINLEILQEVLIPCAPLEEQVVIVAKIEKAESFISAVNLAVNNNLLGHLDQSLLATAFRGELAPQDPADEPASVLLDRIRAARAQAGDAPRPRRPRRPRTPAAAPPPARAAEPATPYRATADDPYATLLSALRAQGSLASSDAQAATGRDAAGVRPLLQRLVAEGAAKVEGQKRGTRYVATRTGANP